MWKLIAICLLVLTISLSNINTNIVHAWEDEEEITVKLEKKLHFTNVDEAKASLTNRTLVPPYSLGIKKDEIHKKLGMPKEVYGYGGELYRVKEGTLSFTYTTDNTGEVVVTNIEFRPKKEINWQELIKSSVTLPISSYDPKSKTPLRLTTQIRIDDIGTNQSMQITLIGNRQAVTFVNWSLIL